MQVEAPAAMQGVREMEEARFQKSLSGGGGGGLSPKTGCKLIKICF
jgi:hypothetical protein